MKPLSADTPIEVERVWIAMQRERGPLWRLRRAVDMTRFARQAARAAIRRAHPQATPREQDLLLLTELYGEDAARGVVRRREEMGFYE